MTSPDEVTLEQIAPKPPRPDRKPGPLETEVDRLFAIEEGKNPRLDQTRLREDIIKKVGLEAYKQEVFDTDIRQALEYVGLTEDEYLAKGKQLGYLLVLFSMGKTPDEIREILDKPFEGVRGFADEPKAGHMAVQAAVHSVREPVGTMREGLAHELRIKNGGPNRSDN